MKLIIDFSARAEGNCSDIARCIAEPGNRVVHYRELQARGCAECDYECFQGPCKYRGDGVYALYESMAQFDRVVLIVPMYCGNPSSLYFAFNERGQEFFRSEEAYNEVVRRLYVIGVYGSAEETPDFVPCLEKWFACTGYTGRVLGLERRKYEQKMADRLLEVQEVREKLEQFLQ